MEEKRKFTQEEREIILKDLAQRLPYNVAVVCTEEDDPDVYFRSILTGEMWNEFKRDHYGNIYRPILRKFSSMTNDEFNELTELCRSIDNSSERQWDEYFVIDVAHEDSSWGKSVSYSPEVQDWMNEHFFDYRGMIPEQLAIECTKKNCPNWYPKMEDENDGVL